MITAVPTTRLDFDSDSDLDLDSAFGNGTGEGADTSVDSARPPCPPIHPRTAIRGPSSTQSMASRNANAGGSRINTQRLLGHSRAMRIDKAAAAGGPQRTKPRSSTTTTTPTTPTSASASIGFRDPLVVRRVVVTVKRMRRALKRYRLLPKSLLGSLSIVHQLASWWLISIRAGSLFFIYINLFVSPPY